MSEQAKKVKYKNIPQWAQGLYYNSGLMSEILVYYDEEAIYIEHTGQGERHSALHLRDDRGPEDSGGRSVPRLPGLVRVQLRRTPHGRTSGSVKLHSPVTTLG